MNTLTILNVTIHATPDTLYLSTDLWVASGKRKSKQASTFLSLLGTKELIKEMESDRILGAVNTQILRVVNGDNGGTYMCKELCYAYAMWLSPKFYILTIRAFDSLVNAKTTQELIDLKFKLDNAIQQDLISQYQQPRHENSLQVLMKVSPFAVNHFFNELEYIGEVKSILVPQPPKRVYVATEQSKYVIGKKGDTLLFSEDVVNAFPEQHDWTD